MKKTQAELMRELMDSLTEGWGDDPDDYYDYSKEDRAEWQEYQERRRFYQDKYEVEPEFIHDTWSLEDLPHYERMVKTGNFVFEERKVESLQGAPERVNQFICSHNLLETLEFGPKVVTGVFDCSYNELQDFEHAPVEVGSFISRGNYNTWLDGSPRIVHNEYIISYEGKTVLNSYDGAPEQARSVTVPLLGNGNLNIVKENFKNVKSLSLIVGSNQTISNALSLFAVNGLEEFHVKNANTKDKEGAAILSQYLPMGKKGMMKCQLDLIKAGLKEWAKL